MCGEPMRLESRERVDRVPGSQATSARTVSEWLCPECDYFEESDGEFERE